MADEVKLLTMKQVYALYLVEWEKFTHQRAAEEMNINRTSITRLISRAKKKLRDGEWPKM